MAKRRLRKPRQKVGPTATCCNQCGLYVRFKGELLGRCKHFGYEIPPNCNVCRIYGVAAGTIIGEGGQ